MGIGQNLQYVAKGCFLEGTLISTPEGDKRIENLRAGDEVISYNEKTGEKEVSKIGEIDILTRDAYYVINDAVKATADHPFYTTNGIQKVGDFDSRTKLIDIDGTEVGILSYVKVEETVTVYNLLDVLPNNNYYAAKFLVHNKGCFLPDMRVVTPTGTKKIKDIRPKDTVISYNEKTGAEEYSSVSSVQIYTVEGYYTINDTLKVTDEHPMYVAKSTEDWFDKKKSSIVEVKDLKIGDHLIEGSDMMQEIYKIEYTDKQVQVYNLINVEPNHNYFVGDKTFHYLVHNKGGGGCFLAGTQITTKEGTKNVEDIVSGDKVVSYNEQTGRTNTSTVERLDVLTANEYYVINEKIKVTGEHPFYTHDGIKLVHSLTIGDKLITEGGKEEMIFSIDTVKKEVFIYNLINVTPNHNYYANGYLVHNKGGGGARGGGGGSSAKSSSGSKSSSSGSSSSKSTSSSNGKGTPTAADKSANTSSSRSTTSAKTAPGSKVTAGGKEVQTSSKKPANTKVSNQAGITGVDGYSPRFTNGYTPPAGSVVYYPQHSALDYLPWIYLFSQDSPARDQVTTVEPSGKEVTAQPVQEGVDGLAVFNWILLIVIALAIIGGIIWGVNKLTTKDTPKKSSYGSWY